VTDGDPYVDVDGVLINKLGIASPVALSRAEADLSLAAMLRLAVRPLPGPYAVRARAVARKPGDGSTPTMILGIHRPTYASYALPTAHT
jgi:hypothetical protein